MKRIALVRRRDGETEPYDSDRVADSVRRALSATGADQRELAVEIGAVVSLFLEKAFYDEIPTVDEIEEMVEKVLIETGYAAAAKAFILHRDRRARMREARDARSSMLDPTLFGPRVIHVEDAVHGSSEPFSQEALARLLASDRLIPRAEAQDVAARVEQRLRRAGVARAPASLVRSLAEVEVFERTLALDLRRRAGAVLAPEDVSAALHRPAPRGGAPLPQAAAAELGGSALRAHVLSELLPADAARAHMRGDLHIHGLTRPGALLSASFSPDEVKRGATPGSGTRGVAEAAGSSRRLAAALGRAARQVAAAVSGPLGLDCVPLGFAPLLVGSAPEQVAEEAWHLVFETAADVDGRALELDLTPEVPDRLADANAVDGAGATLELPNAELADVATRFSGAVLRALSRGRGLPARELLPVPVLTVSERTLAGRDSLDVLRLASELALADGRVVFVLGRHGGAPGGTRLARPPRPIDAPGSRAQPCAGRVTLNLPRAALLAGRGNVEGFLRQLDKLIEHAARIHRRRRELLAELGGRAGGSLAPLMRGARGRDPLFDLAHCTWSFGITGLNEAVQVLTGFELHEDEESTGRTARRIVEYLRLRVQTAGLQSDYAATLDADEDPAVAERLARLDRQHDPIGSTIDRSRAFTPGVAVRADAPVDALHRLECEEPLHSSLSTATLSLRMPVAEFGGPDGLLALLRKLLRAGKVGQVEVQPW